jgi:hypothetical protein
MAGQAMSESGFQAATTSEKSLPSAISAMAGRGTGIYSTSAVSSVA